jgi:hypothetical protein
MIHYFFKIIDKEKIQNLFNFYFLLNRFLSTMKVNYLMENLLILHTKENNQ